MSFNDYLITSVQQINRTINDSLQLWRKEIEQVAPRLLPVIDAFIEGSQGGKRLRGALVKFGYEMTGALVTDEILKPAAAFEIFQTSILAHDDIIDLSPLRRGKPTIYRQLGGDHYGVSQTIALGDVGFFFATKLIANSDFPEDKKNVALRWFSDSMLQTGLGQMLDIEIPHSGEIGDEQDSLAVSRLKTAWYTIIGPISLGAVLGGAKQELLDDIKIFGENLGVAFQIQDDILGIYGDETQLGKSVTSDIEEGKNTLLIAYALKHADEKQQQIIDRYYGKGSINHDGFDAIRKVFEDCGALEYSRQQAVQYVEKAKAVIPQLTSNEEQRNLLTELADFLVNRSK